MIEKIKDVLNAQKISEYLLRETEKETAELFFIKKNLDMRRAEQVHVCAVTVYRDFKKDNVACRGESSFEVGASASEEEIARKCRKAYLAAGFVANPYYELPSGEKRECVAVSNALSSLSLEEAAKAMAQALFAEDTREKSFLNSAELFVERITRRICNSKGVDVSYIRTGVNGEFVAQCREPQDVETYEHFSYDDLNTEALKALVRDTLKLTEDRAAAAAAPVTGVYDIVLSDEYAATVFGFYRERCGGSKIYQHYSDFKVGDFVQGNPEEVAGELLNLDYVPDVPFSDEGVPMKELSCIEDGVFRHIQANVRFAYYLNVPPTGWYRKLSCAPGKESFEAMKGNPGLYVVNFSDFQINDMDGYFGGEIRLAYLNDGERVIPVTGGSVSGSIFDAQKNFTFSKEMQDTSLFRGPKAILLRNVSVAGRTE